MILECGAVSAEYACTVQARRAGMSGHKCNRIAFEVLYKELQFLKQSAFIQRVELAALRLGCKIGVVLV